MSVGHEITDLTRRNIFDELALDDADWSGVFSDAEFLERLYDLEQIESTDHRFPNAFGDIDMHTNQFHDWGRDWIFRDERFGLLRCPDWQLLSFLCETLHPMVRRGDNEAPRLAAMFNGHLLRDGWHLVPSGEISGHPVYAGARVLAQAPDAAVLKTATSHLDRGSLARLITRLQDGCARDPEQAIGQAKNLVEAVCKTIIEERTGAEAPNDLRLHQLAGKTRELLRLLPEEVDADDPAAEHIKALLGQLSSIVERLGRLRNIYGDGHGRSASVATLEVRHGRLAAHAAIGLATFLLETHDDQ